MLGDLIYSVEEIEDAVISLALKIDEDYKKKKPVLIGVLKGSYIFLSDLSRVLMEEHTIDFICIESYGMNGQTQGEVRLLLDTNQNLEGKDVIIVEDIVDSGKTIDYIKNIMASKGAKSVAVCSLLVKKKIRDIDYYGFVAPDKWLVG